MSTYLERAMETARQHRLGVGCCLAAANLLTFNAMSYLIENRGIAIPVPVIAVIIASLVGASVALLGFAFLTRTLE